MDTELLVGFLHYLINVCKISSNDLSLISAISNLCPLSFYLG